MGGRVCCCGREGCYVWGGNCVFIGEWVEDGGGHPTMQVFEIITAMNVNIL